MRQMTGRSIAILCSALTCLCTYTAHAADPASFKSHLFEKGTLVYSDDFDGALDRERWGLRTKKWEVKDGMLIGIPSFKNAQEAQRALGRDHHLGLGPVIRLNKLPAKFVCHLRFKFEGDAYKPARPKL
ncbi:MAG: hypothetical protein ABGZ17_02505, partial [Planctomycetaceae bacterium]